MIDRFEIENKCTWWCEWIHELSLVRWVKRRLRRKAYKRVDEKNGRVSEAEPNTQCVEVFMIDRLGAFLIFITAFLPSHPHLFSTNINIVSFFHFSTLLLIIFIYRFRFPTILLMHCVIFCCCLHAACSNSYHQGIIASIFFSRFEYFTKRWVSKNASISGQENIFCCFTFGSDALLMRQLNFKPFF